MKKIVSALLILVFACTLLFSSTACAAEDPVITDRKMTFYLNSLEDVRTYPVYFMGDSDVPYFSLADWAELMPYLMKTYIKKGQDISFDLSFSMEGDIGILVRKDGDPYPALFDCAEDTIYFLDYDAFQRPDEDRLLIDALTADSPHSAEDVKYFQRTAGSYERYGTDLKLDLGSYGIDLVTDGENCYVPMQTLADFLLSLQYMNVFYNGEAFYVVLSGAFGDPYAPQYTEVGEQFHAVKPRERSVAMAEFSCAELCLAMDRLYGLKEAHGYDSFETLAKQAGCYDALRSTDTYLADKALYEIITLHLNDGHSNFLNCSPLAMSGSSLDAFLRLVQESGLGSQYTITASNNRLYGGARAAYYPDGVPAYEEVGNTAYITFDHFADAPEGVDYYQTAPTAQAEDTIGIMLYAYSQIMREGSPVENVVLDLSYNGGGSADTAVFVMSAFIGQGSISLQNTMTGAIATGVYQVDMNLDRQFDEQDLGLTGKNLFCLTSPMSFSCGNMVPNVFKNTGSVVLLGRTSGGGSCSVLPMSTAYGSEFTISSPWRLAFAKNGSFYDIDRGVDPDFSLARISTFYDRQTLTDYINSLH